MVSWCSWRIGMSRSAAHEHLRVGRALADLPAIDRAMAEGLLSYSKVRVLTRVARPENEEVLLNIGRGTSAAQLERICRGVRRATAGEDGALAAERWVSSRPAADDNVEIVMRLRPEIDQSPKAHRSRGPLVRRRRRGHEGGGVFLGRRGQADGAVAMAESVLRGGTGKSPAEIVVHIDAARGEDRAGRRSWGPDLPAPSLRRRGGADAGVRGADYRCRAKEPGGLERAQAGPGQPRRRQPLSRLRSPMRTTWSTGSIGGETVQENLLLLCRRHHVAAHEGALVIEGDACGVLVFRDAGGQVIEAAPALPATGASELADPWSLVASDGSPVQYEYVIDLVARAGL
jgi:hypothetical protein